MQKVAIITDSTVNLPTALLEQYSVAVLPQTLIWDNQTLRDGIDILPEDFYIRLKTSKTLPTTSQVTPAAFSQLYNQFLQNGQPILAILLSSKLSGTIQSATQARDLLPGAPIEIVDSQTTSLALGFQVLVAARAADQGASLAECKAIAEKAIQNSGVLFLVDTLEYLHRGGRIGGGARFLGTAFDLKPILEVCNGRIEPLERVRTRNKAYARLLDLISARVKGKSPIRLGILDANAPIEAKYLVDQVRTLINPEEIIQCTVSPVVGAHAGPGTVGIAYLIGM